MIPVVGLPVKASRTTSWVDEILQVDRPLATPEAGALLYGVRSDRLSVEQISCNPWFHRLVGQVIEDRVCQRDRLI